MVPHADQHQARVLAQRVLAHGTYAVRIDARELSTNILPGQFFMIRPATGTDPLLGRPFALYDTIVDDHGDVTAFEFAYHVIGKMTGLMSHWEPGEQVELWGPLGNGFPVYTGKHLLCVGGGIGYTPFLAVARETLGLRKYGNKPSRYENFQPAKVTLAYGVQSKRHRADLSDFESMGTMPLLISTDDGSEGRAGFVTETVRELLDSSHEDRPDGVYCCGPEPMMYTVARLCRDARVPCWLSLETPMACGFGACFSCVTRVKTDDGWDYRRTCIEGPIFPADSLAYDGV
ncbi:MAG: dihydroorotate dehydrogenase electron transfer subunit [Planctomycetaceae bacterium]|nr:dihydroorotate dehydrogenase electron transfer subunit [Planctomycetaceae bacterium]